MRIKHTGVACGIVLSLTGCDLLPSGPSPRPGVPPREPTPTDEVPPGVSGDGDGDGDVFFPSSASAVLGPIVEPEHRPPAISGGTLAVSRDGSRVVAADPDRDLVYVVAPSDSVVTTIQLSSGAEPGRVALDHANRAHVVLRGSGRVARIDLGSPAQVEETDVCALPRGIAYDSADDAMVVACANGELVWLSAADHAERARRFVDHDLRDVVFSGSGELFVSRYRSSEILRLSSDGEVIGRSLPREAKVQRFDLGGDGDGDGDGASDPNVPAMEPFAPRTLTMTPTLAWRMVPTDTGVLALHQRSQIDEVVPGPGGYGGGCDTITQPAVTAVDSQGAGVVGAPLSEARLAVDLAVSPDGMWVAAAAAGTGPTTGTGGIQLYRSVSIVPEEPAPGEPGSDQGPIFGCGGTERAEGFDLQVTAVAFDGNGKLYAQSREPAKLAILEITTESDASIEPPYVWILDISRRDIVLDNTSARDTGHELFHRDMGGGMTCASCHGEALDDGHVWTFAGFGPRRTQNIRGGLLATAPFHWEGDMQSFQHLVDEVMTGRMSGAMVEPEYAAALGTWIDRQPALRLPSAATAAVARGKVLFESSDVGCATCHSGEHLTNNLTADVGTGGLFQVPSLVGLGLRAPFMHDGCAATLADRFDAACGGGDAHGKTSQLNAAEISDLSAYLETL